MRNISFFLLFLCMVTGFTRAQNPINKAVYHIDTILPLDGEYSLAITKKKFAHKQTKLTPDELEFRFITLQWLKGGKVVEKIDSCDENFFNYILSYDTGKEKKYFLSLMSFYGGSGYMAAIYRVYPAEPGKIDTVTYYHELDWCAFNETGTEMLILKGIWDMGGNSDEGHFTDHRYEIYTLNLDQKGSEEKLLATTRYKYPSVGEEMTTQGLVKLIKDKEPGVFKKINPEAYLVK